MNKREFVMLAKEYVASRHRIAGWWMSEKLDGQRAIWDGGASRGELASRVPYANCVKDARYVQAPVATGLWSRGGKVIHAPDWWLDELPVGQPIDMELWVGRGKFQEMRTVVGKIEPDAQAWEAVTGWMLDCPWYDAIFADGRIYSRDWSTTFDYTKIREWIFQRTSLREVLANKGAMMVDEVQIRLREWESRVLRVLPQIRLPFGEAEAREVVERNTAHVVAGGGEGTVLRCNTGVWIPKRVDTVLKVKPAHDAEGIVTGFTWGRRTNKGSRHLGRMGALVVELEPPLKGRLELSGFTDEEREVRKIDPHCGDLEPELREGKAATECWEPIRFPRGTRVTFTYRELSDDGIPKEARYKRVRESE